VASRIVARLLAERFTLMLLTKDSGPCWLLAGGFSFLLQGSLLRVKSSHDIAAGFLQGRGSNGEKTDATTSFLSNLYFYNSILICTAQPLCIEKRITYKHEYQER
jgi:hypothetical protein